MDIWEFFLGLAVGNLLGTWTAQKRVDAVQKDFDTMADLCEKHQELSTELLELLSSRNERVCQPKEN